MALIYKKGTQLKFGIQPVSGCVAQSGSVAAGGELKTYRDENGNYLALYLDDAHKEVRFEGILRASDTADKQIGDQFSAFGVTGYITAWEVQWANNDVAKVSGSLRDYAGL